MGVFIHWIVQLTLLLITSPYFLIGVELKLLHDHNHVTVAIWQFSRLGPLEILRDHNHVHHGSHHEVIETVSV